MFLDTEGFTDITIKYMGGLWVLISFQSIKAKENFLSHAGAGSWFSSLQQPLDSFHTDERIAWIDIEGKRVCIKTKMVENIFESFKIIVKGKVYWTRVKEVTGWNPDFMEEEDTQTESDNATIQSESNQERIPETVFENEKDSLNEAQSQNKESVKAQSEDPFNISDILNKKHENVIVGDRSQTADTLKYPPGFTPNNTTEANSNHDLPPNIKSGENTMLHEDVVSNKPNHKPKKDGEVSPCMFKGVSIGSNLHLSHLFYADDVVFLGQWSNSNISTIIKVLKCFFCASGLSINMHKSKLMGIAVDDDIVNQAAHSIGCLQLKSPFSYLGSRIGGSMSRINSWDDIVNKLLARLSKWKMKTLSIGGRLTLLKSVLGSTPIYYMSLFKVPSQVLKRMESIRSRFFNGVDIMEKKLSFVSWNKVLASKNKGGLGVSSFFAMNRALMFKWVWRFKTDSTSLWAKFILAMHGKDGNLITTAKSFFSSIWLDIIRELHNLKNKGIDLLGLIKKKIGNGVDTLFWEDTWKGDIAFKFLYPRIYKLETSKQINVASKLVHYNVRLSLCRMPKGGVELEQFTDMINSLADLQLPNMQDRWFWSLSGSRDFSVALVRKIIDDHLLLEVSSKFSWRKMVPIKVNILAWKVKLDILPTRFNLSKRGLDINSILCPICENHAESSSHLFFACSMARDIFRNIASWWDVKSPHVSSFEEWEM
ncbi:RNA-directed DNA polymerase, eukaryota, reverse transcriptase zinc-binding domain protein [Tanacetum coccineum]